MSWHADSALCSLSKFSFETRARLWRREEGCFLLLSLGLLVDLVLAADYGGGICWEFGLLIS